MAGGYRLVLDWLLYSCQYPEPTRATVFNSSASPKIPMFDCAVRRVSERYQHSIDMSHSQNWRSFLLLSVHLEVLFESQTSKMSGWRLQLQMKWPMPQMWSRPTSPHQLLPEPRPVPQPPGVPQPPQCRRRLQSRPRPRPRQRPCRCRPRPAPRQRRVQRRPQRRRQWVQRFRVQLLQLRCQLRPLLHPRQHQKQQHQKQPPQR